MRVESHKVHFLTHISACFRRESAKCGGSYTYVRADQSLPTQTKLMRKKQQNEKEREQKWDKKLSPENGLESKCSLVYSATFPVS